MAGQYLWNAKLPISRIRPLFHRTTLLCADRGLSATPSYKLRQSNKKQSRQPPRGILPHASDIRETPGNKHGDESLGFQKGRYNKSRSSGRRDKPPAEQNSLNTYLRSTRRFEDSLGNMSPCETKIPPLVHFKNKSPCSATSFSATCLVAVSIICFLCALWYKDSDILVEPSNNFT